MKYYGIYYSNSYKVTKRYTEMRNNREWLKNEYGTSAKGYKEISAFEYYWLKLLGKSVDVLKKCA